MISWADRQIRLQGEDDVIENNDSLEALIKATERLHKKIPEVGRSLGIISSANEHK